MKDPEIQKLIDEARTKKFYAEASNNVREEVKTMMGELKNEQTRSFENSNNLFKDFVSKIVSSVTDAIKSIKIDSPSTEHPAVNVTVPEIKIPTIVVPDIKIPTIVVPKITVPEPKVTVNVPAPVVNVPAPIVNVSPTPVMFPNSMSLRPGEKPFPVVMMDIKGKPMQFPGGGSGGGRGDFFTIKDIQDSSGASIIDAGTGAMKITGSISVSAATVSTVSLVNSDGTYYNSDNPLPITGSFTSTPGLQISGATDSINIAMYGGNTVATGLNETNSGVIRTVIMTDSVMSVNIVSGSSSGATGQGDAASATRVVIAGNSDASVVVNSGTLTTVTTLTGVTNSVQMVVLDRDGNPFQPFVYGQGDAATAQRVILAGNSDASVVVNSGTITTVTTLTGITNTVNVRLDSPDGPYTAANPLPTTATISLPAGQGDSATATRVVIAGNSDASVVINSGTLTTVTTLTGITNTVATSLVDSSGVAYSGSNPLPTTASVSLTLPSGPGDGATATRFIQAGDTVSSINLLQINGTAPATGLNETNSGVLRTVVMTDSVVSVNIVSGSSSGPVGQGDAASATRVVIAGNSDASVVINSGTITTVTTLTGVTNTVNVRLDSPDGVFTGSNPLPVTLAATGSTQNVTVVGASDSIIVYQARTTLPTALADGADVRPKTDKYGRTLTRPIQVRDLTATAYVSLTTGTEATLLAASAGKLYDLMWVLLSNQSTAAVQVDVRPVLAGNILMTFQVPANGTVGIAPPAPLPGGADTGNAWTVDMPDITGTTVNITGLFSQEV